MSKVLWATAGFGVSLLILGSAAIAIVDIRGVLLAFCGMAIAVGTSVVVVVRRRSRGLGTLTWIFALSACAAFLGFKAGPIALDAYISSQLETYAKIADRCTLLHGDEYCKLTSEELKYVRLVASSRTRDIGMTTLVPKNLYIQVVRAIDPAASEFLLRKPCVRHIKDNWFVQFRC